MLYQTGSSSGVVYDPSSSKPGGIGRIDPRSDTFIGKVLRIGDSGGYGSLVVNGKLAWVGDSSEFEGDRFREPKSRCVLGNPADGLKSDVPTTVLA